MTAYIIRRVIIGFIILILVTMLVFLFVRLLTGFNLKTITLAIYNATG